MRKIIPKVPVQPLNVMYLRVADLQRSSIHTTCFSASPKQRGEVGEALIGALPFLSVEPF